MKNEKRIKTFAADDNIDELSQLLGNTVEQLEPQKEEQKTQEDELGQLLEQSTEPVESNETIEPIPEQEVDINDEELKNLQRPNTLEEIRQGISSALGVNVEKDIDELKIQKEIQKRQKKTYNERMQEKAEKISAEYEDFKNDGTIESIFDGISKALGQTFSEEDKEKARQYVESQKGRKWLFMSVDESTTQNLEDFIGLYYQLKRMNGFIGEYFDLIVPASEEMGMDEYEEIEINLPEIFSPSGFFNALKYTSPETVKSPFEDKLVNVKPQKMFSDYIFTISSTESNSKEFSPAQLKQLRDKKQYTAEIMGGFVEKKIREMLFNLQKMVDSKLNSDPEGEAISEEHGLYLTPFFAQTEYGDENDEGINVARLATKNNGAQFIEKLLKTSAGYVQSVILNSIFNKDLYLTHEESTLEEEKQEEAVSEIKGTKFLEISYEERSELINKIMRSSQLTFPIEEDIGKFLINFSGRTMDEYELSDGVAKIVSKPGSDTIMILTNIIDNNNKSKFMKANAPFDLNAVKWIIKEVKKFVGPDNNEATKELINKLFTYAKIFKVTDSAIIEDRSEESIRRIKTNEKIPPRLPILFGYHADGFMNKIVNYRESKKKEEKNKPIIEQKTKEKPAKTPEEKKSGKKTKLTTEQLKAIFEKIYASGISGSELNKQLIHVLEQLKNYSNKSFTAKEGDINPYGVINEQIINFTIDNLEKGKEMSLEKIQKVIDNLKLP